MNGAKRREKIEAILTQATEAVSAFSLAEQLQVSRQIIVGDIALLRAQGLDILSTPKGYVAPSVLSHGGITFKIACLHDAELTEKEIYAIVDQGGTLLDVIVEHPIYGQLAGQLNISSRYDADNFLRKIKNQKVSLLCHLTDGVHLHTIACKDDDSARRIQSILKEMNILLRDQ